MKYTRHFLVVIWAGVLIGLFPPLVTASFLGTDLIVPAVGRGEGNAGSRWYTTVWFHNPGNEAAEVTVSFLERNQANLEPETQILTVPASSSLRFEDAIFDLFGLESGSGAFRIRSQASVAVGARIFNQTGTSAANSQGQFMAGFPLKFSAGPGQSTEVPGILQPEDGAFRSNFGGVETSGNEVVLEVTLLDADGTRLAGKEYNLLPFSVFQESLNLFAPGIAVEGGILRFEVTSETGSVLAYASVIGNGTYSQDPTTLEMTLNPALLGAITGIEAGPGLTGGGNEGVVSLEVAAGDGIDVTNSGVSITPGGIRADHIGADQLVLGAQVGQEVLKNTVGFEAGANVNVTTEDNTIVISAFGCFGDRQELPLSHEIRASVVGHVIVGTDELYLSAAGRWRVGYRVLTELHNKGYGTLNAPVNIVLFNSTTGEIIRPSLSAVSVNVDLLSSVFLTLSGEAVIDVGQPSEITLAARTSESDLIVTITPDGADLSPNLSDPDSVSFIYSECIHLEDTSPDKKESRF